LGTGVDPALFDAGTERLRASGGGRAGPTPMSTTSIVAYYRVSTRQQKRSGLGLIAQQDAVRRYVAAHSCKVLAELTEVESGRDSGRPKLAEALWFCRVYDAKLVIARLDRLARSTAMIAGLLRSGVDFVAADMPLANRFTIHILAAVAYEARLISERTKAAFATAKARGRKFGNPDPSTYRFSDVARKAQVRAARERAKARALNYLPLLCRLRDCGETLHGIALQLTAMEIETPGKRSVWRDRTVAKMFEYAGERKPRPRASRRTQAVRRAAQLDFQLAEYFLGG
jgi:DNA invertase Pin-like site-specific DNA recombinase